MRLHVDHVDHYLPDLVPSAGARSSRVATKNGVVVLSTVEHLFAALAGAGVHRHVAVLVRGPEPPLADGGAARFFDALAMLSLRPQTPSLLVVRDAVIDVGSSRFTFSPYDGVDVSVHIDFGDARLTAEASWSGDARDFRERIAPARTFAMAHEVAELAERGLASHVVPESVVVIGESILCSGPPFSADEPARHKLLDLIGDLYPYGGPPRGRVHAVRPGHAANHEALARALADGVVRRAA